MLSPMCGLQVEPAHRGSYKRPGLKDL